MLTLRKGLLRAVPILYRGSFDGALGGGAAVTTGIVRLQGFRRVVGVFSVLAGSAAAAGFPRVQQRADWSAAIDISDVIPQDPTMLNVSYPFDILLRYDWVNVDFTNGGVASNTHRFWVKALPE